jgi:hypothetical protein
MVALIAKIDKMIAKCPHEIVEENGSAWCKICERRFGWYCSGSPNHVCYYYTDLKDGVRGIHLHDGEFFTKIPDNHDPQNESDDWCIFCGQPEERK